MHTKFCHDKKNAPWLMILVFCFFLAGFSFSAAAQTDDISALKDQVGTLLDQNKFTEALPLLEKIAVAEPKNADMQFYLGYCLFAKAIGTKDEPTRRQLRVRARGIFLKAKELGKKDPLLDELIETIPADGSEKPKFSENKEANSLMEEGEAAFTQGKNDEALKFYQKALALDPKLYYAALFTGDVYKQKSDFANPEIWYQKAIAIDPNLETAYRYSANPLMQQGKYDQARDRYVESYITNPFSRLAVGGLTEWAKVTKKGLGHPKIDFPTGAGDKTDDGSAAWAIYGDNRAAWQLEKAGKPSDYFTKAYPKETKYRHSLAEEFEALKMVIAAAQKDTKVKMLDPSLAKLIELHEKGLLEAYILLARTDEGIAKDFMPYLKSNRAKLRQYVLEYVIH